MASLSSGEKIILSKMRFFSEKSYLFIVWILFIYLVYFHPLWLHKVEMAWWHLGPHPILISLSILKNIVVTENVFVFEIISWHTDKFLELMYPDQMIQVVCLNVIIWSNQYDTKSVILWGPVYIRYSSLLVSLQFRLCN